jgi:transposase-like protein
MSNEKTRRKFNANEKFEIVKSVITKSKTVSENCDTYGIHPNQYYRWQKAFFEGAYDRFNETKIGRKNHQIEREKEDAEKEIKRLTEVIAEVVKENIYLKKKILG